MNYFLSVSIGYCTALFFLLRSYKRLKPYVLRYFLWFILYEYALQFVAANGYLWINNSDHYLSNIHTFIETFFYLSIYRAVFLSKKLKKATVIFFAVFVFFYLIEICFVRGFFSYLTTADFVGRLSVFACCFLYLVQLLVQEDVVNYFRVPMFWITTGVLISLTGDWIYVLLFHYIINNNLDTHGAIEYPILIVVNNAQYLLFAIAFYYSGIWKETN